MRGIGQTLSRLPVARGLVAGAALLAGAAASAAHAGSGGTGDQTALAIPRIELPGDSSELALPQPLAPSDVARIRRIFADQARGRMTQASWETGELTSTLLLGTILADRYLGPFHHATVAELAAWLQHYADEPDASPIRALLRRRLARPTTAATRMVPACLGPASVAEPARAKPSTAGRSIAHNAMLDRDVSARVQAGRFATALHLIARTRGLKPAYGAWLRSTVARGLFAANHDEQALDLAVGAWRGAAPADRVGQAAFVAGLAAWRLGDAEQAGNFFRRAAGAPVASAELRAAASYWASRASLLEGDQGGMNAWLQRAAAEQLTFYGLIARRRLGLDIGPIAARSTLVQADLDVLAATGGGLRAFALLQVGQTARAEQEFRCLWPQVKDDALRRRALQLVAAYAGLTGLAAQMTALIDAAEGIADDEISVPVPKLRPAGGFRFDPALVYGLTRAESNFDPAAVSAAGARGLMQIMPVTARAITGDKRLTNARLGDPGFNLELGQRLVLSLAGEDEIAGGLLPLLASYNAGLGGFASWAGQVRAHGDPLLFIESIPIQETRQFVQRALAYTWIYAARLGLPAASLNALASGEFPAFTAAGDGGTVLPRSH